MMTRTVCILLKENNELFTHLVNQKYSAWLKSDPFGIRTEEALYK